MAEKYRDGQERINFYVAKELKEIVMARAHNQGLKLSDYMRELIKADLSSIPQSSALPH